MPQPNEPAVQQYFDEIIQNQLGAPPITCAVTGDGKGKGLFATRAVKAGEMIWSERPFVAMQHEDNKDFADCCDHCFVSLINSKDAWERVEAATQEAASEQEAPPAALPAATFQDFESAIELLQKQGGKSDEESYFNVYRLAKNKVQCICGVLYCSEQCQKAAFGEQHAILCPRSDENASPMGHFINHTLVTNEIFQLAAKVIARVLSKFIETHDLKFALQPVEMFCKLPWWEVVVCEDDLDEGQTLDEQREIFKNLISQTLGHLMNGLQDNLLFMEKQDQLNGLSCDAVLNSCQEILSLEFFGKIVGMFEMNNISMEIDHPFHTLSEALLETVTEEKKEVPQVLVKVKDALEVYAAKYQHAMCDHDHDGEGGHGHDHSHDHDHGHSHDHHHHHDHDDDEEDDEEDCCGDDHEEDFVGVEGTALFPTICTMNHHCDPNCTVIYMKDGSGQVYAVQDINNGDELCISYIDVDQTLEERQECLREYQFQCFCARCEEERHA